MLKSYNRHRLVLVFLMTLVPGLGRADIIDDITQVEPKKEKPNPQPTKTPEKKSVPLDMSAEPLEIPKPIGPDPKLSPKPNAGEKGKDKKFTDRPRREAPIHLASEGTSTYSKNGSVVQLQKNVVITQDDVRLQSDEAKVIFLQGKKENNSSVQAVELTGKVNVSRFAKDPSERVTAKSERAIFVNDTQKVTLDGNARIWKDGHLVRGDRIIYDIVSGEIKIDRAQGVVQPEKAGK